MTQPNDLQPPDCLVLTGRIAAQVELIREEMGRPTDTRPAPAIAGAAPRECWFAALALAARVDRLLEPTGRALAAPAHPPAPPRIRPGHVHAVLEGAHAALERFGADLGVTTRPNAPARDDARTPSDVLAQIIKIDRQLDLLLDRPLSPSDVFGRVELAVGYAGRLLAAFAGAPQRPESPRFERARRPGDCYRRLAICFQKAKALAERGGQTTLEAPPELEHGAVIPADCYDLATLVVAELAFLHAHQVDANPPYPFENAPARGRLPSHVFQLVGVLEAQLAELDRRAAAGWLQS
jgi:hypothetical protein